MLVFQVADHRLNRRPPLRTFPFALSRFGLARQQHFRSVHFLPSQSEAPQPRQTRQQDRAPVEPPQTPYARRLASLHITAKTKARLRAEHARLNPFALK